MIVSLPDELLLHVARLLIDKNFVPSALRLRQASRALHARTHEVLAPRRHTAAPLAPRALLAL